MAAGVPGPGARPLARGEQLASLAVVDFIRDLVTDSPKETYSRDELLVVLTLVMRDSDLFTPESQAIYDEIVSAVEAEA